MKKPSKALKRRRSNQLPVIESCSGCGVCCTDYAEPADVERFKALPENLLRELEEYLDLIRSTGHPNDGICIWFDEQEKRCKHYELRPEICRNVLQPGDEICRRWRKLYGIEGVSHV